MSTHLHLVLDAALVRLERLRDALAGYARAFNRRHKGRGLFLVEGELVPHGAIDDREALYRAIAYVHDNPCKTRPAIVDRAYEFPWSSAREYAGLAWTTSVHVHPVRDALGGLADLLGARPRLADIEPVAAPDHALGALVAAAAQTHRLPPEAILDDVRAPAARAARLLFVHLARRESYTLEQIARAAGRSGRSWAANLAAEPPPFGPIADRAHPAPHARPPALAARCSN